MRSRFVMVIAIIFAGLLSCRQSNSKTDISKEQKTDNMNNMISIVEIPTTDFGRAVNFYQAILNVTIEEVDMGGVQMGVIPNEGETVSVVLVKGADYEPTAAGAVVYLNAGENLQPMLDRVTQNGGKELVPKTEISPEMGYFALFIDTEGNKLGLHSTQ